MTSDAELETRLRSHVEASFPASVKRASEISLQAFIPANWFSAAASECARMYVDGYFFGAISVCQAYVEALSKFLASHHSIKNPRNDVEMRWRRLLEGGFVSQTVCDAACSIYADRNDFHHLNQTVEQGFPELGSRARDCLNSVHIIESEVFGYSFEGAGKIAPRNPQYWTIDSDGRAQVFIRSLW